MDDLLPGPRGGRLEHRSTKLSEQKLYLNGNQRQNPFEITRSGERNPDRWAGSPPGRLGPFISRVFVLRVLFHGSVCGSSGIIVAREAALTPSAQLYGESQTHLRLESLRRRVRAEVTLRNRTRPPGGGAKALNFQTNV